MATSISRSVTTASRTSNLTTLLAENRLMMAGIIQNKPLPFLSVMRNRFSSFFPPASPFKASNGSSSPPSRDFSSFSPPFPPLFSQNVSLPSHGLLISPSDGPINPPQPGSVAPQPGLVAAAPLISELLQGDAEDSSQSEAASTPITSAFAVRFLCQSHKKHM